MSKEASKEDIKDLLPLVLQLTNAEQRENALLELSKKRELFPDLAPVLWHSFGTIAALIQEILSIYPMLSPATLTPHASNRVCNALALLQCVASHPETKSKLMNAHIPLYLFPFLNTVSRQRPFEYLRLTSLGVIGALVKIDDSEVVSFLLQTEIIPLCLRIMETGSELSKTVATFIVQKILLDDLGLNYICSTSERFYAVSAVLSGMVAKLQEHPSVRLLKHIVRCYLRLSEHPKAREALRSCLPEALTDQSFGEVIKTEEAVQRWLASLLKNLSDKSNATLGGSAATGVATTATATPITPAAINPVGTAPLPVGSGLNPTTTTTTSPTTQQQQQQQQQQNIGGSGFGFNNTGGFGLNTTGTNTGGFGTTSSTTNTSGFGTGSFTSPNKTGFGTTGFGTSTGGGGFGKITTTGFGSPGANTGTNTGGFGTSTGFGSGTTGFGKPTTPNTGGFGTSTTNTNTTVGFGASTNMGGFGTSTGFGSSSAGGGFGTPGGFGTSSGNNQTVGFGNNSGNSGNSGGFGFKTSTVSGSVGGSSFGTSGGFGTSAGTSNFGGSSSSKSGAKKKGSKK